MKPSEETLIYFATFCWGKINLRHSTIKLYLAGIKFYFLSNFAFNPMQANGQPLLRLEKILKAIKRLQGAPQNRRLPLTAKHLCQLCHLLNQGVFGLFVDRLLAASFTLAFFGFLRCGEFTCQGADFDPSVNLKWSDLKWVSSKEFHLNLPASKTDPFRAGVTIRIFANNSTICPVKAMLHYCALRRNSLCNHDSPLFINESSKPLTRTYFLERLRTLMSKLCYPTGVYSGHSFRSGAATTAAACSIPDHLIKAMGRWVSDSYERYIKVSSETIQQAHQSMSNFGV